MANHSRILAWKIPGIEVPRGLQSMESPRVRHNLATNIFFLFFFLPHFIKYSTSAFDGNTRKSKGVSDKRMGEEEAICNSLPN